MQCRKQEGFTLLELSIVIIIIGLLLVGVTMGGNLIRQADLRAIVAQVGEFRTGVATFKQAYLGRPGDLFNATSFWTGGVTSNGNGDDQIIYLDSGAGNNEGLRAWQHLALANMVAGNFSGDAATDQQAVPKTNVPKASLDTVVAGYFIHYEGWLGNTQRNIAVLGGERANTWNDTSALIPVDAEDIDKKLDDGRPGAGLVWAQGGRNAANTAYSANCVDGTDVNATYFLEVKTAECQMAFGLE